jgi:cAMP phosphodiesterase
MKIQLLPSSFDDKGNASQRQHLSCLVIDDCVTIDAGSLAMAATALQKKQIRDIVLTHAHLDHIAGLPLFIDDLFATLEEPVCIHATKEVIETLERDIFNWEIYPRFTELKNGSASVMQYQPFESGKEFCIKHLQLKPISVNHKVPTVGFVVSDEKTAFAISGDTAEMDGFWHSLNPLENLPVLLMECSFPNELDELAQASHHLTPRRLQKELTKFNRKDCSIYVINIKPMYRSEVIGQIEEMNIENLEILEIGRVYDL